MDTKSIARLQSADMFADVPDHTIADFTRHTSDETLMRMALSKET